MKRHVRHADLLLAAKSLQAALMALGETGFPLMSPNNSESAGRRPAPSFMRSSS
jgi:hypothetical protein